MLRRLIVVLMLSLALGSALGCGSNGKGSAGGKPSSGNDLTRTAEADGITVEARWLSQAEAQDVDADVSQYPIDAFVLLELKLDTHSGDLNEIDLQTAVMLRRGQAEASLAAWVSESDDSHHREGVLVFPKSLPAGPVELAVTVGDEAVVLIWEDPPRT